MAQAAAGFGFSRDQGAQHGPHIFMGALGTFQRNQTLTYAFRRCPMGTFEDAQKYLSYVLVFKQGAQGAQDLLTRALGLERGRKGTRK